MAEQTVAELLALARGGDREARGRLLELHRDFVFFEVTGICKRALDWANDDELSIGLLALDEAIERYRQDRPGGFRNFARMVIRSRLVDYFRREGRNRHLSLNGMINSEDDGPNPLEVRLALAKHEEEATVRERAAEIARYREMLIGYGITLGDLERSCPRHRESRKNLVRLAQSIAGDPDLLLRLKQTKCLPLQELMSRHQVHRKVLERGRRYIIAVTLILAHDEFEQLRSFVKLPDDESEE